MISWSCLLVTKAVCSLVLKTVTMLSFLASKRIWPTAVTIWPQ